MRVHELSDKLRRSKISRISMVLAEWCPHCHPLSVDVTKRLAAELGVPLRLLDIDNPQAEELGDRIVKEHGDYVEDYLIPQVFLEFEDGRVQHIFTGFSEGVHVTERRWEDFRGSPFYKHLVQTQLASQAKSGSQSA